VWASRFSLSLSPKLSNERYISNRTDKQKSDREGIRNNIKTAVPQSLITHA
jgi:hypothetical protein